jgi:Phage integrase family
MLFGFAENGQPLRSDELRAISARLKERARMKPIGKAFFVSEQHKQHRSTVNLLMQTYSKAASLPLLAHPHMLRHACGFALADQGADTRLIQDYLGHRNIQHTVKYTATSAAYGVVTLFEPARRAAGVGGAERSRLVVHSGHLERGGAALVGTGQLRPGGGRQGRRQAKEKASGCLR